MSFFHEKDIGTYTFDDFVKSAGEACGLHLHRLQTHNQSLRYIISFFVSMKLSPSFVAELLLCRYMKT